MNFARSAENRNQFRLGNTHRNYTLPSTKFETLSRSVSSSTSLSEDCEIGFRKGNTAVGKKLKAKMTFPQMVHQILEDAAKAGLEDIVAWEEDGASFHIHKPLLFNDTILPKYSKKKTKFRSFQRQLNIYGFKMTKKSGVYRHQLFRRGHMFSIARIRPRTTNSKKSMNYQEHTNDENASSNSNNIQGTPLYESRNIRATVSPPLLRKISAERADPIANQNGTSHDDDIGQLASCFTCDNKPIYRTVSDSAINTITPRKELRLPSMVPRNLVFDLFDDMDEINLCTCNGSGCCFNM